MEDKKCPFCDIIAENERVIAHKGAACAFLTNIPIVPGHTLLAPLRCVANYSDLNEKEKKDLETLRDIVTSALKKAFGSTGFNFAWNEGREAGQSIPHFHLHVVPRKANDVGITKYGPRKFLYRPGSRAKSRLEELVLVTDLIRKHL